MPGFFVDRQDYGGSIPTANWDNTIARTIEEGGPSPPVFVDPQVGIGGSYDFWHNSIYTPSSSRIPPVNYKRSIHTYADDPCCCPELSCCFPETVTATIAGFKEATRVPSRSIGLYGCESYADLSPDKTGRVWYLQNSWCSSFFEASLPTHGRSTAVGSECCPEGFTEVRGMFWDNGCYFTQGYKCCPDGSVGFADGPDARYGNCLLDCDPGENGNLAGAGAFYIPCTGISCPEGTDQGWCCADAPDPETGVCAKPNYIGLCGCNIVGDFGQILQYNVGECWTYQDIEWPESMFPPHTCKDIACCQDYFYDSPIPDTVISCINSPAIGVGEFKPINRSHISKQYLFFDPLTRRDFISSYTWDEICNDTELGLSVLCEKPTNNNIIYGPNTYSSSNPDGGQGPQIYDGDHNGTYICHKTVNSFRPELEPYIERQFPLNRTENEQDKALLLFEVECRRKLKYIGCGCGLGENRNQVIEGFDCDYKYPEPTQQDINNLEVPNSKIYCVDYPCQKVGRALPTYLNNSFVREPTTGCTDPDADDGYCGIFECQASAGSAYPNLMLYQYISESGNGGYISFQTVPEIYENGYPTAWSVNNLTIESKGSGYVVGDTFLVDFDGSYIRRLLLPDGTYVWRGGQTYPQSPIHTQLNLQESFCEGPGANISPIEEKYNSVEPLDLIGFPFSLDPAFPFSFSWPHPVQTIRVTQVGAGGEIESVERVPWYKETEYDALCNIVTGNDRTPIYPLYSRKLCHPQPVQYGGKGYSVGDTIVWIPADNRQDIRIWKDRYAIGYVTDVDDNGSILDWFISGGINNLNESIFQRRYANYEDASLLGYLYNTGDDFYASPCYGSSSPTFDTGLYGPNYDKRGYYYHNGTDLCSLVWAGIGVPIRARTNRFIDWENGTIDPCFIEAAISGGSPNQAYKCGDIVTEYNSGYLTNLNLSISRVVAETSAGIKINKYRYIDEVYATILLQNDTNPEASESWFRAIIDFSPFPECVGGGSEIIPVVYNCNDPTNSSCGNESIFGGSLSGTIIKSSGAYHAFVNRRHVEPILPTDIPNIVGINGTGAGATISGFLFNEINNFPHPAIFNNTFYLNYWEDISYSGLTSDRYSYFELTDIQIDMPGSGYEIDQEFELYPQQGKAFTRGWLNNTADDPNACPNGGWYEAPYNTPDPSGRWDYANIYSHFPYEAENNYPPLESKAKIKITDVDENGGIVSVDIIHKGMMFRCVETTGILHPDVSPYLDSTLGYGAIPNMVIDTNKNSDNFGRVTDFYFTNPVFFANYDEFGNLTSYGGYDPLHSNLGVNPPVLIGWNGSPTRGYGRDYANPENGYFWMLNNVDIDTGVKLLAYYPFGDAFGGPISTQYYTHQSGEYSPFGDLVADNYVHPEYSTHDIIEGNRPPYVPKSTICSFTDCYHGLLNKSYPLYRKWNGNNDASIPGAAMPGTCLDVCDITQHPYGYGNELTYMEDGRPSSNFCVLLKKGKSISYNCDQDGNIADGENTNNYAAGLDYIVVEYGFTMTLSSSVSGCPDHTDGRTWDGNNTIGYYYV